MCFVGDAVRLPLPEAGNHACTWLLWPRGVWEAISAKRKSCLCSASYIALLQSSSHSTLTSKQLLALARVSSAFHAAQWTTLSLGCSRPLSTLCSTALSQLRDTALALLLLGLLLVSSLTSSIGDPGLSPWTACFSVYAVSLGGLILYHFVSNTITCC